MAKPFKELRARMSEGRRKQNRAAAEQMIAAMPLHELRQARRLSQIRLAELLNVQQSAISRMERRTDMYLSTLRSYIQAMGGELVVMAEFPEGTVRISQFHDLEPVTESEDEFP